MLTAIEKERLEILNRDFRERLMDPTAQVVVADQATDGTVRGTYRSCRFRDPDMKESRFVWFRDGTLVSEASRTM